jgi:hypothetical protein
MMSRFHVLLSSSAFNLKLRRYSRALRVAVDYSVTAVNAVADVRVRTPAGTSETETGGRVVTQLQSAIDDDRVSHGTAVQAHPISTPG